MLSTREFIEQVKDHCGLQRDIDLAKKLNIRPSNLSHFKNGIKNIRVSFLIRVHLATGIEMDKLYEMTGCNPWGKYGKSES
mgnify:CR=1 FL=1